METTQFQDLTPLRYESGSIPKPETNKNYVRLYGHNCCGNAEKARLALIAKGI